MSFIAEALSLRYPPLALHYAQSVPPAAKIFKPGGAKKGWGCVMFLLSQAARGETAAFTRESSLCPGATMGMGLGPADRDDFPGGADGFLRFLSNGNKHSPEGLACAEKMRAAGADEERLEEFLEGEGFKKNPELTLAFMRHTPRIAPGGPVLIIKPLDKYDEPQPPAVVLFLADAEQLSALVGLVSYASEELDVMRSPFGSGCQQIALFPLYEAAQEKPKAIMGLTDISARLYIKKLLGRDLLSFAVPWRLYKEMEENAPDSFLRRQAWKRLHT